MEMKNWKVALTLGIVCCVLTFGISVQLKSVNDANGTVSQTLTSNDLRDQALKWKEKYDKAVIDLEKSVTQLEEIRLQSVQNDETSISKEEETEKNYTHLTFKDAPLKSVALVIFIIINLTLGLASGHIVELIEAGYEVVVADNMSNCDMTCFEGVKKITGKEDIPFYQIDCCDYAAVDGLFTDHKIDAVIHFAAFKAVGESVAEPIMYYRNNLVSFLNILEVAKNHGGCNVLFSSSATVYGQQWRNTPQPSRNANVRQLHPHHRWHTRTKRPRIQFDEEV